LPTSPDTLPRGTSFSNHACFRLRLRPPLLAALILWFSISSLQSVPARSDGSVVVIVSLDGVRYDFPNRVPRGAFARIEKEGVRASRLEPPFPASTFPAHVTLATGCYPERHGILNSRFRDARRGEYDRSTDPAWIACEPLWVTAEKKGVRSAVSNWIGSYGAWRGIEATYHDEAFAERSDRESIGRILAWLQLPEASRPRLILAYLAGTDHVGHLYGPQALQVTERIRMEDRILSLLLEGLQSIPDRNRISLLVVSDHGMVGRKRVFDPGQLLTRGGIPNRTFSSGGCANVYLDRRGDQGPATRLFSGFRGFEVFTGGHLPPDLHYSFSGRTGDLVILAPVGIEMGPDRRREEADLGGVHGYRGTEDLMGGIFYAWGAGIQKGSRVGRVRAVDVYTLVCRLLGIEASDQAQGGVPPGVLKAL